MSVAAARRTSGVPTHWEPPADAGRDALVAAARRAEPFMLREQHAEVLDFEILLLLQRPVAFDLLLHLRRRAAALLGEKPPLSSYKAALLTPVGCPPIQGGVPVGAEFPVRVVAVLLVEVFLNLLEPVFVQAGQEQVRVPRNLLASEYLPDVALGLGRRIDRPAGRILAHPGDVLLVLFRRVPPRSSTASPPELRPGCPSSPIRAWPSRGPHAGPRTRLRRRLRACGGTGSWPPSPTASHPRSSGCKRGSDQPGGHVSAHPQHEIGLQSVAEVDDAVGARER